ncbi:hypothetical protein NQP46_26605 [Streptomyces albus]|nr:hypothetical protein NQP46_26605 [Streptomyces albus]
MTLTRAPHAGFSTRRALAAAAPGWAAHAADRQDGDRASMLTLYRTALALRRATPGLGGGPWNGWRAPRRSWPSAARRGPLPGQPAA